MELISSTSPHPVSHKRRKRLRNKLRNWTWGWIIDGKKSKCRTKPIIHHLPNLQSWHTFNRISFKWIMNFKERIEVQSIGSSSNHDSHPWRKKKEKCDQCPYIIIYSRQEESWQAEEPTWKPEGRDLPTVRMPVLNRKSAFSQPSTKYNSTYLLWNLYYSFTRNPLLWSNLLSLYLKWRKLLFLLGFSGG